MTGACRSVTAHRHRGSSAPFDDAPRGEASARRWLEIKTSANFETCGRWRTSEGETKGRLHAARCCPRNVRDVPSKFALREPTLRDDMRVAPVLAFDDGASTGRAAHPAHGLAPAAHAAPPSARFPPAFRTPPSRCPCAAWRPLVAQQRPRTDAARSGRPAGTGSRSHGGPPTRRGSALASTPTTAPPEPVRAP